MLLAWWGWQGFEGLLLFHLILSFMRLVPACTPASRSLQIGSGGALTQMGYTWRASLRSSILRMRPSQFHGRSLALIMTSIVGVLASSAMYLLVLFDSILERAEFNFLRTFSVIFHYLQPNRGVDTTVSGEGCFLWLLHALS